MRLSHDNTKLQMIPKQNCHTREYWRVGMITSEHDASSRLGADRLEKKKNFREHKSRNATNSWNQSEVEHNGGAPTAEVNSKDGWLATTFYNDSANPNMLKNMDVTWLFPLISRQFRMSASMQKANGDWSENESFMCRPVWWKGSVMPTNC